MAVGSLLALAGLTSGFDIWRDDAHRVVRWPSRSVAVFLEDRPHGDMSPQQLAKAVKRSIQRWNDVEGAAVRLVWGGIVASDPRFDIFVRFSDENFTERSANLTGRLRIDAEGGDLQRARVDLNAQNFLFTTAPTFVFGRLNADLDAALTHQLGHALGIGFSQERAATMYFFAATPEYRSLEADDKRAARWLYPTGPREAGQLCEPCDDKDACDGRCLTWPDGYSYCSRDCVSHDDCPVGYSCGTWSGGKACLPNGKHCAPNRAESRASGPCANDLACPKPLFCLDTEGGGFCTAGCSGFCAGFGQCRQVQLANQVVGLCLVQGDGDFGAPCEVATDCVGLLCSPSIGGGGRCGRPCASGCPSGATCDTSAQVCVTPGELAIGWPCKSGFDCASGLCVDHGGAFAKVCAASCAGASDCPAGTGCTPTSDGLFCLPFGAPPPGAPCASPGACGTGHVCDSHPLPGVGRCAPECDPYSGAATCGSGERCVWVGPASASAGACRPSGPGALAGEACGSNQACRVDLVCAGPVGGATTCRAVCTDTCAGGGTCVALSNRATGPRVCSEGDAPLTWQPAASETTGLGNFAARPLSLPDVHAFGTVSKATGSSDGCAAGRVPAPPPWWVLAALPLWFVARRREG